MERGEKEKRRPGPPNRTHMWQPTILGFYEIGNIKETDSHLAQFSFH